MITRRGLIGCLAVVAGMLLVAAPALALTKTVPAGSITGSGPTALTNPTGVAVDQQSHDLYVTNPPANQRQTISVDATGGTYTLSFKGQTTSPIPFDAAAGEGFGGIQEELGQRSTVGIGNVFVFGPRGGPYVVEFVGALAATEQPLITANSSGLTGGTASVTIATTRPVRPEAQVEKFTPAGEFLFSLGSEVDKSTGADLCTAASDDECQPGALSDSPGAFRAPTFLATDPTSGDLYVGDTGDSRVSKFSLSGQLLAGWQAGGQLSFTGHLHGIAVDPGGDLFVLAGNTVHRYSAGGQPAGPEFSPPTQKEFSSFGLAVDAENHLYGIDGGSLYDRTGYGQGLGFSTTKFNAAFGEYLGSSIDSRDSPAGLAIEPGTSDLFVLEGDDSQNYYIPGGEAVEHFALNCGEFQATEGNRFACPILETLGTQTVPLGSFGAKTLSAAQGLAIDADGTTYVADTGHSRVAVFSPLPVPGLETSTHVNSQTSVTLDAAVEPGNGGEVTECEFQYNHDINNVQTITVNGAFGGTYALTIEPPGFGSAVLTGIAYNTSAPDLQQKIENRFRSLAGNISVSGSPGGPYTIEYENLFANTSVAPIVADSSSLSPPGATVTAETNVQGVPGGSPEVVAPCQPTPPFADPAQVSTVLTGVAPLTTYHFRLLAANARAGDVSSDRTVRIPLPPSVSDESVAEVNADSAAVHASILAGGGSATYHVEYLTAEQVQHNEEHGAAEFANAQESTILDAGSADAAKSFTAQLAELKSATTYRYRVVVENALEAVNGVSQTFTTQSFVLTDDPCPNAHVRQQTSAAQLLDCRAYELVSAANTAGYDVESSAVPGQMPFGGYPDAANRVLYGVHNGGIPGTGEPTNHGVDPYVATRGENGWSTRYVGIPANGTPSTSAFGSPLLEADSGLDTFAFGGAGICSPCFADGSTGVPLHLSSGELVQGMVGPEDPGPGADPVGYIGKHFSADGTHFVFGSESQFAPEPNGSGVSIYDHNLKTGETQVVSKTPAGATMTGPGVGELDISSDGSRIVIGQKVSEDADGNVYWHLYMNVGDSNSTIDLTPGTTSGVLYDGMTADGSKVFFTTKDKLLPGEDSDSSADLYSAEVSAGSAVLHLLSIGTEGTGNTDSCDPAPNSVREHWNTVGSEENCGVAAIGGGGGVASGDGSIYFLSPELLDGPGNGVENAPNLYLARPGSSPRFVTTLESVLSGPQPPQEGRSLHGNFGSFAGAAGLAVDHQNGDVYVLDDEAQAVEKFDRNGNPVNFTASGPNISANKLTGLNAEGSGDLENGSSEVKSTTTTKGAFSAGEEISGAGIPTGTTIASVNGGGVLEISQPAEATATGVELSAHQSFGEVSFLNAPRQLAVDNDPSSPSYGDLYVPDFSGQAVHKFSSTGEYLKSISVSTPIGVAVDQANGHVYVTSFLGSTQVFDAEGNPAAPTAFPTPAFTPTSIAVSASGIVYVASSGGTAIYDSAGNETGILDPHPSEGVAVDSSNGDVYVNEGTRVVEYDSSGNQVGVVTNSGDLSASVGLAVDPGGDLYTTDDAGKSVSRYGTFGLLPSPSIDSPVVIDAVGAPATRRTADFQVTPDGEFSAFPSTQALAGGAEEPAGHTEIYRYDAASEALACASCRPFGAAATGDASLASGGLSLTAGGRVFFESTDPIVLADTDNKRDVYEWEPQGAGNCQGSSSSFNSTADACLSLVSAGTSPYDSGLLGASSDAQNVYLFTRDSLVPQDENGPTMKIYDAREGGGFPYSFPPVACKASDECHGPSSAAPGPLKVSSGTVTEAAPSPCKKGFVKKRGKCVRKARKPHKPRKHNHHKRAKHHVGGAK